MLDRWILSRSAGLAAEVGDQLNDYDAVAATRALSAFIDDLSTWYSRRSRDRMRQGADLADQAAAFAHAPRGARRAEPNAGTDPAVPVRGMYQNLIVSVVPSLPDSVHLTAWPADAIASFRDEPLERAMATIRKAVELARTLRAQAGIRVRQPLGRRGSPSRSGLALGDELLALFAEEVNAKDVEVIADGSALVERRVKPLLPRIGKRLGPAIPAVMAAARSGEFEILAGRSVQLAGVTPGSRRGRDPGDAATGHGRGRARRGRRGPRHRADDRAGAEGDAREFRAVQDLRARPGSSWTIGSTCGSVAWTARCRTTSGPSPTRRSPCSCRANRRPTPSAAKFGSRAASPDRAAPAGARRSGSVMAVAATSAEYQHCWGPFLGIAVAS